MASKYYIQFTQILTENIPQLIKYKKAVHIIPSKKQQQQKQVEVEGTCCILHIFMLKR